MTDLLDAAFVLHRRDYRDTSQIIELFTEKSGRISVIAKGAKRAKSPLKTCLQMFQPLLVSWKGKNELMTLIHAELQKPFTMVSGQWLAWAFYLNELLYRLLGKHEAYPIIFTHYQRLLERISQRNLCAADLRYFEKDLLNQLGYGLHLHKDSDNQVLKSDSYYLMEPLHTPSKTQFSEAKHVYAGKSLLALAKHELNDLQSLKDSKRLLRFALQELIGDKPFKSGELLT